MGPQQVLRVAACLLLVGGVASARERVAVIDLGPDDGTRQKLAAAIVAGGLEPVIGDGVEDALAGINGDRDTVALAAALAEAKDKFGALACPETIAAAQTAISIGAARQAAGLPVPELARAWTYVLLCADRTNDASAAFAAATAIRTLGGSSAAAGDVDAKLLAKYPDIDALSNREVMEVEIKADVDGADVFLDFRPVGKSPLKLVMATGPHIMAAAAGGKRGTVTGTVIRKQPLVTIPMQDQSSKWSSLAMRVASWHGKVPKPKEIGWALGQVDARIALVRHGDTVEAWGHPGEGEPVRRLGGDDGSRKLDEAPALVALVVDRTQSWVDRAPDPDQPLLTETPEERKARGHLKKGEEEEPTRWWVYATIAGAIVAGSIVIYAHNQADDTQRVELKYP
ncbi:MAG TPA: hypothetical protein VFV99_25900 [Kofleriaceae bacterium]|nr:hypothetical protein [Kofleriaceae bacterium]